MVRVVGEVLCDVLPALCAAVRLNVQLLVFEAQKYMRFSFVLLGDDEEDDELAPLLAPAIAPAPEPDKDDEDEDEEDDK